MYGESLRKLDGKEYRFWDPKRSKLAAYMKKGGEVFPFSRKTRVLYLGAATGTTVSHLSDVASDGRIFAVEFSRIPFTKLVALAEERPNIMPFLGDASHPERYAPMVGPVDVVYQDIAQRDQVPIFVKNMRFLRSDGIGMIVIKARSIDVSAAPPGVFKEAADMLESAGLNMISVTGLEPFEKDHAMIVVRK